MNLALQSELEFKIKEEQHGGTQDWLSMIYILDVMKQGRFGEFSLHKRKIPFLGYQQLFEWIQSLTLMYQDII